MKNLVFAELDKILSRKVSWITLILSSTFLCLGIYFFELLDFKFVDSQGVSHRGFEAISIWRKEINDCQDKGFLPKRITNFEIQKTIKNLKNSNRSILNATNIKQFIYLLNNNYQLSTTSDPDELFKLSEDGLSNFYEAQSGCINKFLKNNSPKLSDQEKIFWMEKVNKHSTPYTYGYGGSWLEFLDKVAFFVFVILTICVAVAPVYSYEYQSKMDSIILASKYGKTKNNIAKIIASYVLATIVVVLTTIICLGITLAIFGADGWKLPIQILQFYIAYPYTLLQLTLLMIGILLISTYAMVALTLLISSYLKNAFHVLIVVASILILPIVFGSDIKWLYLLPGKLVTGNVWYSYISFSLFNKVIDIYTASFLFYFLLILISIPLTFNRFKNHQVL